MFRVCPIWMRMKSGWEWKTKAVSGIATNFQKFSANNHSKKFYQDPLANVGA